VMSPNFIYLGDIPRSETDQIRVFSIRHPQFSPFTNIVMRHRIFWWKKPCVL